MHGRPHGILTHRGREDVPHAALLQALSFVTSKEHQKSEGALTSTPLLMVLAYDAALTSQAEYEFKHSR